MFRRFRDGDEVGIVSVMRRCFSGYDRWGLTVKDWLYYEEVDDGFRRDLAYVAKEGGRVISHIHVVLRKLVFGRAVATTEA